MKNLTLLRLYEQVSKIIYYLQLRLYNYVLVTGKFDEIYLIKWKI